MPKRVTRAAAVMLMVALACGAGAGRSLQATPAPAADDLVAKPGVLGERDLVVVTIHAMFGDKDAIFERHVDGDGRIGLPWIGAVPVKGLSTDRAAAAVVAELGRTNVASNPIVTVGVLRSAADSHIRPGPIAPGAPLKISIWGLTGQGPDKASEVLAVVAGDGTVVLPLAGEVKLDGTGEAEADAMVKNKLKERGIVDDAVVTVLQLEPNGKR